MGATYLQASVWLLPSGERNREAFLDVGEEIRKMGGEAAVFEVVAATEQEEDKIVAAFNSDRDAEYLELIDKCNDFFAEMARETERQNFTFAEVEENEEELEKLKGWLMKIRDRDVFNSPRAGEAEAAVRKCEQLLQEFSERVFEANKSEM